VAEGGFVHARVQGDLWPGVIHEYAFFVQGAGDDPTARSPIGRFVAPPPDDAWLPLTFSGTHGTHEDYAPYPTLVANAAAEPFAFYIHMGDAVYADDAQGLEGYRGFWSANWQTEGFRAVLGQALYLPVWDDHEVENNYDPETIDPGRLAAGLRAFFEANAIERLPDAPDRYWRSWRWGQTAELFALDIRSERRPSTREGPDATYVGPAQWAWLTRALVESDAVFKLVLTSVPIARFSEVWQGAQADRWQGYAAQRQALIDHIVAAGVEHVFFLTGDFHMAMVGRVDPPGGAGERLWEFMLGPGAQANPLGDRAKILATLGERFDPLPPDQFVWGYPEALLSYVDLDPFADPPALTVRYLQRETGAELYRATIAGGTLIESSL